VSSSVIVVLPLRAGRVFAALIVLEVLCPQYAFSVDSVELAGKFDPPAGGGSPLWRGCSIVYSVELVSKFDPPHRGGAPPSGGGVRS